MVFSDPSLLFRVWKNVFRSNSSKKAVFKLGLILPLLRNRIEILHIQWAVHLEFFEELFEISRIRIIVSLRGAHINYSPQINPRIAEMYLRLFPKCFRFHAVSKAIIFNAVKFGAQAEKVRVIYTSLDKTYEETPVESKVAFQKPLELIAVGRFHWVKGYGYLIDALALLKKQQVNFRFTLVAGGGVPDEIKFQIAQHDLAEEINIINGLSHDLTIERIRNSDMLVLPSVVEGMANVAIEAMTVGTIVISSDSGGMPELIEDNTTGYLFLNRDPFSLANTIIKATQARQELLQEIRRNAKNKIKADFSRDRMINEFVALYSDPDEDFQRA
jgi:glycosyltransferase involved in cell wall biosynthesis